jgi:hypothetical protein
MKAKIRNEMIERVSFFDSLSRTRRFPIAACKSCQRSEFTKPGLKLHLAGKLFQMNSWFHICENGSGPWNGE